MLEFTNISGFETDPFPTLITGYAPSLSTTGINALILLITVFKCVPAYCSLNPGNPSSLNALTILFILRSLLTGRKLPPGISARYNLFESLIKYLIWFQIIGINPVPVLVSYIIAPFLSVIAKPLLSNLGNLYSNLCCGSIDI